ncbi:MAG TPA: hypothetical protein VFZ25_20715 [Chloroflexota bacterium]|nr:hypothetical protein [Chloroflexota bacterium]
MVLVLELAMVILVGLTVLPWLFGEDSILAAYTSIPVRTGSWIGLAVVLAIWIVVLSRQAIQILARSFAHLPSAHNRGVRASPEVLAALFVAVCDIVVMNGLLQSPLSAILSLRFSPAAAESAVGVIAVALLLVLLVRLHFVARPYVEGSAWSALDVVVATTSSENPVATTNGNTMTQAAPTRQPTTRRTVEPEVLAATRAATAPTIAGPALSAPEGGATLIDPGSGGDDPGATRVDSTRPAGH